MLLSFWGRFGVVWVAFGGPFWSLEAPGRSRERLGSISMAPGSSGGCLGTSREGPGGTRAPPKVSKSDPGDARGSNKSLFENICFP